MLSVTKPAPAKKRRALRNLTWFTIAMIDYHKHGFVQVPHNLYSRALRQEPAKADCYGYGAPMKPAGS